MVAAAAAAANKEDGEGFTVMGGLSAHDGSSSRYSYLN